MPNGPIGRQDDHPNHAAGAAIPTNSLLQGALDERDALLLAHVLPPIGVAVAVDVRAAGAADRVRLPVQRATQRDRVDLPAVPGVVAGYYDSCTILVGKSLARSPLVCLSYSLCLYE